MAANMVVPWLIVRRDLRRMKPEYRCRAWPDTTLIASVVAFGPLCLPVHFVRTRRGPLGLVVGLVWMGTSVLVSALLGLVAP